MKVEGTSLVNKFNDEELENAKDKRIATKLRPNQFRPLKKYWHWQILFLLYWTAIIQIPNLPFSILKEADTSSRKRYYE
jgi:hypothetical protein